MENRLKIKTKNVINFLTFMRVAFEKISVFILTYFAFAAVAVVYVFGEIFGGCEIHLREIFE